MTSADGRTETLETTDEHPFWREGSGWVGAGELKAGDRVDLIDGSDATVSSTNRTDHTAGITVYNFEVQGDHTYFVADAETSFTNPVWVHNANSAGACIGDKFLALTPQGKPFEFPSARSVQFTRLPSTVTQPVREAFNGTLANNFRDGARAEFYRSMARDRIADLNAAGFSPRVIARMRLGDSPQEGWEVHHKKQIEFGGTNDFENLMLIQKSPHSALSHRQQTELQLGDFETKEMSWPMFEGVVVYPGR